MRLVVAGIASIFILGGVLVTVVATGASAASSTLSLTMTSGSIVIHGGAAHALPTPSTLKGKITSTSGNISTGTLTIPAWHETNTGSSETIHFYDVSPGSGKGTVNSSGDMTYSDKLSVQVHITSPVTETCTASPITIALVSTAAYNKTTEDVTLKESGFTIPHFSSTNCSLAASSLSSTFSGNNTTLTLNLHGSVVEPPPATKTTMTTLTATPASPQLKGTSITLKATVKKTTGALATGATGTMTFRNGTTAIGTAAVTGGKSNITTTTLPVGTDKLIAVYSGGGVYTGSTSPALTYAISPAPTVKVTGLPKTAPGGTTTMHAFTVTVTNPSNGVTFTHLYLKLTVTGLHAPAYKTFHLQYQDTSGTWCMPLQFERYGTTLSGFFAGAHTECTMTFPASFSSSPGTPVIVHFRVSFPTTTTGPLYGTGTVTATLYTGKITGTTNTTVTPEPVAPLTGSAAPSGSESVTTYPSSSFASMVTTFAPRKIDLTDPVRQTFNLGLESEVTATSTVKPTAHLPAPTGKVSYAVDGTTVGTSTISRASEGSGVAPLLLHNIAGLSVGRHQLKRTYTPATYTGHTIYSASSLTQTFTVTTAPTGTAFTCKVAGVVSGTIPAYVTAKGTVPATGNAGTNASVTNVSVTLVADPVIGAVFYNTNTGASFGFSPTSTPAEAGKITFTGTTAGKATEVKGTWSGLSTSVPLKGTAVHVGLDSIDFGGGAIGFECAPTEATTPAPIGTIKVIHTTPVTWTLSGCTSSSTTAPSWANTEKIVAKGAGGGGGGAAAYATGYAGTGGAGSSVTATLTVTGGVTVSAKTGCAGHGAPQGFIPANGGTAGGGWSSGGKGGQGYYCAGFFCTHDDGTGGGGGGSTGVCNGSSNCTSTSGSPVVVAGGGAGGGETMCTLVHGGAGGQGGKGSHTSANGGTGPSGSNGTIGGPGDTGSPGGAGGANNKSSGSGKATGGAGGNGTKTDILGDSAGAGGGGAGYIGGNGGTKSGLDADCDAAGGGGGGSSWVTSSSGASGITFGTGASGGNSTGTNGSTGSLEVIFSYTPSR